MLLSILPILFCLVKHVLFLLPCQEHKACQCVLIYFHYNFFLLPKVASLEKGNAWCLLCRLVCTRCCNFQDISCAQMFDGLCYVLKESSKKLEGEFYWKYVDPFYYDLIFCMNIWCPKLNKIIVILVFSAFIIPNFIGDLDVYLGYRCVIPDPKIYHVLNVTYIFTFRGNEHAVINWTI